MTQGDDTILRPGDCLAGRYVILEEIGRGGFGVVYRAVQQGVNRNVAIKTLRRRQTFIPGFDFVDAFHKEALHTSHLKHPNTITLFDFGETEDGLLFLVTEFLEGETLYERMWRDRIMSPETAVHIGKQIAKSLAEAHNNGIIHGDLKPANIFLCNLYGERDFVKVLDFGIAKIIGEVDPAGMGTPEYMSPEQFSGQPLLAASDIYSLGLIVFEMVMGRRPFDDEDTGKLARKHLLEPLPPMSSAVESSPLGYLIRKATSKEPSTRYEDGWAMYEALENLGKHASGVSPARPAAAPSVKTKATSSPELQSTTRADTPTMTSIPSLAAVDLPGAAEGRVPISSGVGLERPADSLRPASSRLLRGARLPLIGRGDEEAWLLDRVGMLIDQSSPTIIILGGAAGVGKTRLATWLIEEAPLPAEALRGSGAQRDGSPFVLEGIRTAFARACGLAGHDFSAKVARRIKQRLAEVLGRDPERRLVEAIDSLYGPFGIDETHMDLDLVSDLLIAVASSAVLILHLDNVQSADPTTVDFLEHLSSHLPGTPCSLLLLCTVRREALPAVPALARRLVGMVRSKTAQPRTLNALDEEAAATLAERVLVRELAALGHRAPPDVDVVRGLVRRSHGNPLYILELIRHLIDSEFIQVDAAANTATLKDGVQLERMIPPKIGGLLRLRVAQLAHRHAQGQELETVLLRASLLGPSVPVELLRTFLIIEAASHGDGTAATAATALPQLLNVLSQEDILAPFQRKTAAGLENEVMFTQPLIHQILEERVLRLSEVKTLHRVAADAKRRYLASGGLLPDAAEQIAHHYKLAEATTEAASFMVECATDAVRSARLHHAVEWLERARTACEGPECADLRLALLLDLCIARRTVGALADLEAVKALGDRLAEDLKNPGARAELQMVGAMLAEVRGDVDAATSGYKLAIQGFSELPDPGPLPEAQRDLDLRLLHLQLPHLPPRVGVALCCLGLAWGAAERARFETSQTLLTTAVQAFDAVGFRWGRARTLHTAADLYIAHGFPNEAERLLNDASALYERISPPLGVQEVALSRAELAILRNDTATARTTLDACIEHFEQSGLAPWAARAARVKARLDARLGNTESAFGHFRRALDLTQTHADWSDLMGLLPEFALFLLDVGDPQNALRAVHKAISLLRGDAHSRHTPTLSLVLASAHAAVRYADEARQHALRAIEAADLAGDRLALATAHGIMARVGTGGPWGTSSEAAMGHLQVARRLVSTLGVTLPVVFRAAESLSDELIEQGDAVRGTRLLEEALQGWHRLGNVVETQRLDQRIRHTHER